MDPLNYILDSLEVASTHLPTISVVPGSTDLAHRYPVARHTDQQVLDSWMVAGRAVVLCWGSVG
jgi:hypothetical protein